MRLLAPLCVLLLTGCGAPLLYEGRRDLDVEPLEVRLVRVTASGLVPDGPIRLRRGEGGVAFLNDTRDQVVSIIIEGHALGELRCAYTQGFASDAGATFTPVPLSPGASASLCLHDAGTFVFEARGAGEPLRGTLEVAP
jgi:hypothetical protein